MSDINFLKNNSMIKSVNSKKASSGLIKNLFIISLVVVVVAYAGCFGLDFFLKKRVEMITTDMTEFNHVKDLNKDIADYNEKIKVLAELITKQDEEEIIQTDNLKAIGDRTPEEVSIQNYTCGSDGAINVQGRSSTKEGIAFFTQSIKNSNLFKSVELKTVDTQVDSEKEKLSSYSFTLILK